MISRFFCNPSSIVINKKVVILLLAGIMLSNKVIANESYDKVPITPQTWEEVDLTYTNTISSKDYIEQANLLRPINWIKQHHLDRVGATVHLTAGEIDRNIDVKVIAIKPTNLNYANNKFDGNKPVISTFIKHSNDVWEYTFKDKKNGGTEKIEATSNHPFYSIDRHDYIPIGQVKKGEHLKSNNDKEIVLTSKVKHNNGIETVYNFEVYQTHNYAVGNFALTVHNRCDAVEWVKSNITVKGINNSPVSSDLFKKKFAGRIEGWRRYTAQSENNSIGAFMNIRGLYTYRDMVEQSIIGASGDIRGVSSSAHLIGNYGMGTSASARLINFNVSAINFSPTMLSASTRGINISFSLIDISPTAFSFSANGININFSLVKIAPVIYSASATGININTSVVTWAPSIFPSNSHTDDDLVDETLIN